MLFTDKTFSGDLLAPPRARLTGRELSTPILRLEGGDFRKSFVNLFFVCFGLLLWLAVSGVEFVVVVCVAIWCCLLAALFVCCVAPVNSVTPEP